MMRMMSILGLIAVLVAGCANRDEQIAFDGQYYRAKISRVDDDRQQFAIAVRPVSVSLQGALEAGRYEATSYCVKNYGKSAARWIVGPDQDPGSYRIEDDTIVLRGACDWR